MKEEREGGVRRKVGVGDRTGGGGRLWVREVGELISSRGTL